MTHRIETAFEFGRYVHRNQVRKYSGDKYHTHTERVAQKAYDMGLDEDSIIAAVLHDCVEDQQVTYTLLTMMFGDTVSKYVWWLSDQSTASDGNRKARKAIDRAHIAQASANIKTVKLIDSEDNLRDILKNDKNFAKVYFAEKRDLLEVLRDGDARMVKTVEDLINDYFGKVR